MESARELIPAPGGVVQSHTAFANGGTVMRRGAWFQLIRVPRRPGAVRYVAQKGSRFMGSRGQLPIQKASLQASPEKHEAAERAEPPEEPRNKLVPSKGAGLRALHPEAWEPFKDASPGVRGDDAQAHTGDSRLRR